MHAVHAPLEPSGPRVDDRVVVRVRAGRREHAPAEPVLAVVAVEHQRRAAAAGERRLALGAAAAGLRRAPAGWPGRRRRTRPPGSPRARRRAPRGRGPARRGRSRAGRRTSTAAASPPSTLGSPAARCSQASSTVPSGPRLRRTSRSVSRSRAVEPEGARVGAHVRERDRGRVARRRGGEEAVEAGHDPRRGRGGVLLQQRARAKAAAEPVLGGLDRARRGRRGRRAVERGRGRVRGPGRRGDHQRGERSRGRTGEYGGRPQDRVPPSSNRDHEGRLHGPAGSVVAARAPGAMLSERRRN